MGSEMCIRDRAFSRLSQRPRSTSATSTRFTGAGCNARVLRVEGYCAGAGPAHPSRVGKAIRRAVYSQGLLGFQLVRAAPRPRPNGPAIFQPRATPWYVFSWVAQATRLCRRATRPTERRCAPSALRSPCCISASFSFRAASRPAGRAGRPRHPRQTGTRPGCRARLDASPEGAK